MNRPRAGRWVAATLALLPIAAHSAITDQRLDQSARELETRLVDWRRDLHRNPELGNREFRTAEKVAAHLRQLGLEVKTGIAHTGVAGLLRGGKAGPTIALRADMDALPVTEQAEVPFKSTATAEYRGEKVGVMHACGHDTHVAILMAAAEVLTRLRADLAGNVLFIFQPAEEGPPEGEDGGAVMMLKEGLFATYRPDAVVGLHIWAPMHVGDIGYRSGPLLAAADRFRILVTGRQTHGARPWQGVDPIVTSAEIVGALQTVVSRQIDVTRNPAVVTVGSIRGGIRHNIIPDTVEMLGTIRTFDPGQRTDVIERIQRVAQNIAEANGASATFALGEDRYPVTVNDAGLTQRVLPSLARAVGAQHV
ncbi:MAG TPA: amidohydrolase, partial [Steroidobacteraceae bacterium]|nr:amidohydrolase [Steroidobacteraceae bacterium]